MRKILIIGTGGIGSFLVQFLDKVKIFSAVMVALAGLPTTDISCEE